MVLASFKEISWNIKNIKKDLIIAHKTGWKLAVPQLTALMENAAVDVLHKIRVYYTSA